eukprot:tig00022075_g23638.t1
MLAKPESGELAGLAAELELRDARAELHSLRRRVRSAQEHLNAQDDVIRTLLSLLVQTQEDVVDLITEVEYESLRAASLCDPGAPISPAVGTLTLDAGPGVPLVVAEYDEPPPDRASTLATALRVARFPKIVYRDVAVFSGAGAEEEIADVVLTNEEVALRSGPRLFRRFRRQSPPDRCLPLAGLQARLALGEPPAQSQVLTGAQVEICRESETSVLLVPAPDAAPASSSPAAAAPSATHMYTTCPAAPPPPPPPPPVRLRLGTRAARDTVFLVVALKARAAAGASSSAGASPAASPRSGTGATAAAAGPGAKARLASLLRPVAAFFAED